MNDGAMSSMMMEGISIAVTLRDCGACGGEEYETQPAARQ